MAIVKLVCVLLFILIEGYLSEDIKISNKFFIRSSTKNYGFEVFHTDNGRTRFLGDIGSTMKETYHQKKHEGPNLIINYPDVDLKITNKDNADGSHITITWTASKNISFLDCFSLGTDQWYGGPQQKHQYWPIQKLKLEEYSYVTKEADNAAIMEPYWLSSSGVTIYVDRITPIFIDQNNILNNSVCLVSNVTAPYSQKRTKHTFKYNLGKSNNARMAHMYAIKNFLGKPSGYPDVKMTQHPIWSTWAEYKRPINESTVLDFANNILKYKFNNSQFEIDDLWETCYGSFNVDTKKFPDLKKLNLKLKEMGFRVTVWIHPFINKGCEPWYSDALKKGYLVKSESGKVDTSWWNSEGPTAAYIDFTNVKAREWWVDRLKVLQNTYAIDSFKFDAGETSWSPQIPEQTGDVYLHPSQITQDYVRACAQFGPMVEVRTGERSQDLPIYVRMIDKDSEWDFENGLPTLITTLLQMNMNGYPLVLPDMIGGNGYNGSPSKELFIRWLQANTFMPSLQYSYVPWDYDNETINISHKFTDLHSKYTPSIVAAFEKAVKNGDPVNPPIWWIDPSDRVALQVWDEYLLGEDILVAPVITKGAVNRDVYLPMGKWMAEGRPEQIYEGPRWIRNYSAPLDTLPYFIRNK